MRKLIAVTLLSILFTPFLKAEVVKNIQISGNKRVSNETIKIYGEIKVGKDYSEQGLNKILNNLYETNFFQDVKIELNNGKAFLKKQNMMIVVMKTIIVKFRIR